MQAYDFIGASSIIEDLLQLGNSHLSQSEFWKLVSPESTASDYQALHEVVYVCLSLSHLSSVLLHPFCPDLSNRVLAFLSPSEPSLHLDRLQIGSQTYSLDLSKKIHLAKVEPE